ncbi:hypothetical protein BDZ89DRAFT_1040732 [Hymenopellis radicata]|nr:hypothetical protein BDZ89DRAFT_1040732 [Hymenopellis radicata]
MLNSVLEEWGQRIWAASSSAGDATEVSIAQVVVWVVRVVVLCCRYKDSSSKPSTKPRPQTYPTGCLTIVRAGGATIVTPWVVVVVVVVVESKEIPLNQMLTRRFGTRPGSPD